MITKHTIMTGATGALAVSACEDFTVAASRSTTSISGSRERIGAGMVAALALRSIRVGSAAGWNSVDVPTPVLVRSGGASG